MRIIFKVIGSQLTSSRPSAISALQFIQQNEWWIFIHMHPIHPSRDSRMLDRRSSRRVEMRAVDEFLDYQSRTTWMSTERTASTNRPLSPSLERSGIFLSFSSLENYSSASTHRIPNDRRSLEGNRSRRRAARYRSTMPIPRRIGTRATMVKNCDKFKRSFLPFSRVGICYRLQPPGISFFPSF